MKLGIGEEVNREVVIITGACGGIGLELVSEFTKSRYHVIAIDKVSKLPSLGNVDFLQVDLREILRDQSAKDEIKNKILELAGPDKIKGIINNAAVQKVKKFEDVIITDWNETLDTNLLVPFFFSQLFLYELTSSKGSIVNISSIHASQTKRGFSVYATSKAALSALTRALAIELGSRVRLNSIEPGAISTQMLESGFVSESEKREMLDKLQPIGRIGNPSEVAKLALFLTSNSAQFMNGSIVAIDGGIRSQLHDPM